MSLSAAPSQWSDSELHLPTVPPSGIGATKAGLVICGPVCTQPATGRQRQSHHAQWCHHDDHGVLVRASGDYAHGHLCAHSTLRQHVPSLQPGAPGRERRARAQNTSAPLPWTEGARSSRLGLGRATHWQPPLMGGMGRRRSHGMCPMKLL